MPLIIEKVDPQKAFDVEYQGLTIPIYFTYRNDMHSDLVEDVFTADIKEGVRKGQQLLGDVRGAFGFTSGNGDRNDYWFSSNDLFELVKHLPEFKNKAGVLHSNPTTYEFQWLKSYIVQVAIDHELIGFDDDFRFIDATSIDQPIKSCTGGMIMPKEACHA